MTTHFVPAASSSLDHLRELENSIGFNLFLNRITQKMIPDYQKQLEKERDHLEICRLQGKIEAARFIVESLLGVMVDDARDAIR